MSEDYKALIADLREEAPWAAQHLHKGVGSDEHQADAAIFLVKKTSESADAIETLTRERDEATDREHAVYRAVSDHWFLDPPDGGDVKLHEGVARIEAAWKEATARAERAEADRDASIRQVGDEARLRGAAEYRAERAEAAVARLKGTLTYIQAQAKARPSGDNLTISVIERNAAAALNEGFQAAVAALAQKEQHRMSSVTTEEMMDCYQYGNTPETKETK